MDDLTRITNIDDLAALIRQADGDHTLGAGALAEAIVDGGFTKVTEKLDLDDPTVTLAYWASLEYRMNRRLTRDEYLSLYSGAEHGAMHAALQAIGRVPRG